MYNLTWRMIRKQLFYVEVSEVQNTLPEPSDVQHAAEHVLHQAIDDVDALLRITAMWPFCDDVEASKRGDEEWRRSLKANHSSDICRNRWLRAAEDIQEVKSQEAEVRSQMSADSPTAPSTTMTDVTLLHHGLVKAIVLADSGFQDDSRVILKEILQSFAECDEFVVSHWIRCGRSSIRYQLWRPIPHRKVQFW